MPRIQHKRGTSANLASVNPTPLAGELVWDSTENAIKIGDGSTAWTSLAYVTATPRTHTHAMADLSDVTITSAGSPAVPYDVALTYNYATSSWVAKAIGLVGVGGQPFGGWPAGSVGAALAGKVDTSDARLTDTRTPTDNTVSTAKLQDDAVTYAKLQNVSATDRLLGRSSAGAGDVQEITCTAFGRSLIDDADAAAGRTTLGAAPAASPTFTGVITVAAGTAAAPALVASGDANTGAFFPAADTVAISTAGSERVRVRSDGYIGLGGTGASNIGLNHQYTLSSASTRYGELIYPTIASGGSATVLVCAAGGSMAASSSATTLACFHASNVTLASGASVTNQYGVFVGAGFTGGTNNYGIYSAIASGSGRWNFYADSTAGNYFGGDTGIKTNGPTAALDINADTLRLRTARTPASAAAAGNAGDICWDASYLYICTSTNTWRRIAHDTW